MTLDLKMFSDKIKRFKTQRMVETEELSVLTGISRERLHAIERAELEPTGDEVLILADYFICDYNFFISNEKEAPIERTEILFRRHGKEFSKEDRKAVQEVLYMAECEHYLMGQLGKLELQRNFYYSPSGDYFKGQAADGAKALREFLGYADHEINRNVFDDIRQAGFHIFRRLLGNSNISGVSVNHPTAGRCILINYNEDVYRQRFTMVHEAAHGIFDLNNHEGVFVSMENRQTDYLEVRANYFASQFLMPRKFLSMIPNSSEWDEEKVLRWANDIKINPEALAISLKDAKLINNKQYDSFKNLKILKAQKSDAELPISLSENARSKKLLLLRKGLSDHYVKLCFDAYMQEVVSFKRIAEMLLIDEDELHEMRELYGVKIQ